MRVSPDTVAAHLGSYPDDERGQLLLPKVVDPGTATHSCAVYGGGACRAAVRVVGGRAVLDLRVSTLGGAQHGCP